MVLLYATIEVEILLFYCDFDHHRFLFLVIIRPSSWRNIKKLQEIGRLRQIGGDNGGYWEEISI